MKLAYTMGHKKTYDHAFEQFAAGEIPSLSKIGRTEDLNGEYYSGGCCWPTYKEAKAYIDANIEEIPYVPEIYGIMLPNGWDDDTSDDTYEKEGFYSLLVDSDLVRVDNNGKQRKA